MQKNKRIHRPLKLFRFLFSIFMMLVLYQPHISVAGTPGADVAFLSKILVETQKQVKMLQEQLEEMKKSSDAVIGARNTIQNIYDEYQFVTEFNPDAELNKLANWADDFTNLDNLNDAKTLEEKWRLISNEIDKRFRTEKKYLDSSPEVIEKMKIEAKRAAAEELAIQSQIENFREIAKKKYKKQSGIKGLDVVNGKSNAMIAALMLEEKLRVIKTENQKRQEFLNNVEKDASFVKFLKGK